METKNKKKLVSFSIDDKIVIKFNEYCNKSSINKSLFIENYIKKVLDNE